MSQIKINKLSSEDFLESFKKVPRAAVSIAIYNDKSLIMLTKRNEDPFKGNWHLPGSFIIKSESIDECIERVLEEELGFGGKFSSELLFISEDIDKDPRGHAIDLIYKVKVDDLSKLKPVGRTADLQYFDKIDVVVGFNHSDVLKKLGFVL